MSVRTLVKQERRDRILFCAQELISHEGFEGLSIRVLAAKAKVSTPTIYNLEAIRKIYFIFLERLSFSS
jgi:AcrR family transcriptional regulator